MHQDNPQGKQSGPRINQYITEKKVRLVDEDGEMQGVVLIEEALQRATKAGLDLVEVSPNAEPPVCKILDYGKYKYAQQKKKNEAKKKQKTVELKEIQLRPMIGKNDLEIKCRAAGRFLEEGNKVKFVIRFRGREFAHNKIGMDILHEIRDSFNEIAKVEHEPKLEGRQMIMILGPR